MIILVLSNALNTCGFWSNRRRIQFFSTRTPFTRITRIDTNLAETPDSKNHVRQAFEGRGPTGLYALYLIELADNLGINLVQAIRDKLAHNTAKYPVSKSKGSAAKYTEL